MVKKRVLKGASTKNRQSVFLLEYFGQFLTKFLVEKCCRYTSWVYLEEKILLNTHRKPVVTVDR